jgi:hypothetical protein
VRQLPFDARLQCSFCPKTFKDFGPLGSHVQTEHPEIRKLFAGEPSEEEVNMLPRSNSESSSSGGRPVRNVPFLTSEHLSRTPKEAKIIMVRDEDNAKFGLRINLKIAMDGKMYIWTVRIKNNPNYNDLTAKFGHEENDWVDQRILIGLEKDEFNETYYARVSFPSETTNSTKRTR